MSLILTKISDIDHNIIAMLKNESFSTEELQQLVDTRDQLLHEYIVEIKADASLVKHPQTLELMNATQRIAELLKTGTQKVSEDLNRLQYGKRSVQQYQQFK